MPEAFIIDAVRTPGGKRKGVFADIHPADLGAVAINAILDRTGVEPDEVDDLIIGCVTQAGEQSVAFGRNVVLASNLPETVPAVTIDRQCGSSQQALHFAAQAVMSETQDIVIAGGAESMTRVPMLSALTLHMEAGIGVGPLSPSIKRRFGVEEFSQFVGAQMIADKYGFSRDEMDRFALESHRRAAEATRSGAFRAEIVPVPTSRGMIDKDEGIRDNASIEGIGAVRTITESGTITAANASQITDGASAVLVMNQKTLQRLGARPKARIVSLGVSAGDPVIMLEQPIEATRKALARAGLKIQDIDLFEVNEAFASIPLAWMKALDVDPDKVNVNGGAIALGHPLGASGTKLMATLIHALHARNKRYGLLTMCQGGGIANVTIVEAV